MPSSRCVLENVHPLLSRFANGSLQLHVFDHFLQAEASASKQAKHDAKVQRKMRMRAKSVGWNAYNKEGMTNVRRTDRLLRNSKGAVKGDAYGFIRAQQPVNSAPTSSTSGHHHHHHHHQQQQQQQDTMVWKAGDSMERMRSRSTSAAAVDGHV